MTFRVGAVCSRHCLGVDVRDMQRDTGVAVVLTVPNCWIGVGINQRVHHLRTDRDTTRAVATVPRPGVHLHDEVRLRDPHAPSSTRLVPFALSQWQFGAC